MRPKYLKLQQETANSALQNGIFKARRMKKLGKRNSPLDWNEARRSYTTKTDYKLTYNTKLSTKITKPNEK